MLATPLLLCLLLALAEASKSDAEAYLDRFLELYLDGSRRGTSEDDGSETMQGDQPAIEREEGGITRDEYLVALKNSIDQDMRSRENRIRVVKDTILQYLGKNSSAIKPRGNIEGPSQLNMSMLFSNYFNQNATGDDEITEKMRSFYPSCDIPANTDQELWKDDEIMNLFFNFDYMLDSRTANVALATLRLYRLPKNGTKFSTTTADYDISSTTEDDKLLRVSIYRYTKPLKRRRVKRVLSDSKVISESARWVELNVKPAAKAWSRSRNLGLAVLVEDQEGNMLRADKYFKGASCTIGATTPKPIPTIVVDAARRSEDLLDRNSTVLRGGASLLPTVDVCVVELPENRSTAEHGLGLRLNACNLKWAYEGAAGDPVPPPARHIRHQRQHFAGKMNDEARSRVVGSTVVLRFEDLQNLTNGAMDFSKINR